MVGIGNLQLANTDQTSTPMVMISLLHILDDRACPSHSRQQCFSASLADNMQQKADTLQILVAQQDVSSCCWSDALRCKKSASCNVWLTEDKQHMHWEPDIWGRTTLQALCIYMLMFTCNS